MPYQRGGGGGGGVAASTTTHKRCRMCGNVCHIRMSSCSSCCLPLMEAGSWEPAHMPRPGGGPGGAEYGEDSSSSDSDGGDGGSDAEDSRIGAAQGISNPSTVAADEATSAAIPTPSPTATPTAAPTTAATAAVTNIPAAAAATTTGGESGSSTADAAMERRRQERRQRAERQGVSKAAPAPLASEKPGDAAAAVAAGGGGTSALSKARMARSKRAGTDSIPSVDATSTTTAPAPDTVAATPPPDSPAPDASAPDETADAFRREVIALQHRVTNASLTPSSADATDDASGAPAAAPWWEEWLGADKLAPPAHPRGFDPTLAAAYKALRHGQSNYCPPRHGHASYSLPCADLRGIR